MWPFGLGAIPFKETGEGRLNGVNIEVASPSDLASPNSVTRPSSSFRSSSVGEWQNDHRSSSVREWQIDHPMLGSLAPDLRRVRSDTRAMNVSALPSPDGAVTPRSRSHAEGSSDESDGLSGRSPSLGSHLSSYSSSEAVDESILNSLARIVESGRGLDFRALPRSKEILHLLSPPSVLEGSTDEGLYEQLEQAMVEAKNSKREAFEHLWPFDILKETHNN